MYHSYQKKLDICVQCCITVLVWIHADLDEVYFINNVNFISTNIIKLTLEKL